MAIPDLLSNELNVDSELLQDLIDEWKKHFINDSTGTINEYISQEIKRLWINLEILVYQMYLVLMEYIVQVLLYNNYFIRITKNSI